MGLLRCAPGNGYTILGCSRFQYKLKSYVFACSHMKKPLLIMVTSLELMEENHSLRKTNRNTFETYKYIKIRPKLYHLRILAKIETSAYKPDPDFLSQHVSIATRCKVNTEMTFCGKLHTEVHDQNVMHIFVVTCKRALNG